MTGLPGDCPEPADTSESQIDVTLPAAINGQILAGDRDRYRFTARKGHRLVVAVQARRLIPYLADGVPGWFQAIVTVYDAKGEELACTDHYRFDPDPVVSCEIPADGQYTVEITDALYRGREDFVYRISIGELPFVTSIFPLGGRAGSPTNVQITGWNLPSDSPDLQRFRQVPRNLRALQMVPNRTCAACPSRSTTCPNSSRPNPTTIRPRPSL